LDFINRGFIDSLLMPEENNIVNVIPTHEAVQSDEAERETMVEEEGQESTVTQEPISIKLETVNFDARFPNTNQTKHCWQKYIDYHKCIKALGEGHKDCRLFQRDYRSLCPMEWVNFFIFSKIIQYIY
jgi:cytochrome c oxidase subunit 6b